AKKASLQICRPEIACDFRQICQRGGIGGGSSSPAKRAQARDKSEFTNTTEVNPWPFPFAA
ncbi:MAG: hypothetical protein IKF98_07650, partial [Clostridia bacterium]|nr:hypothetical protein [Clostridia bacterium]